jgi:hypothetical protein
MGATREKRIIVKDLQVRNSWTFTGDIDAQQDAAVGGDTEMTGDLAVGGDVEITGTLDVTGDVTVADMEATGAAVFAALSATAGQVRQAVAALTETGAIGISSGLVTLSHAETPILATKAAPTAGDMLIIVNTSASGTEAHTVTLADGVTWNGTNRVATLDAPGDTLFAIATSATRFLVVVNIGSVGFSNPA